MNEFTNINLYELFHNLDCLFYNQKALDEILDENTKIKLLELEVHDWLSTIYWGEMMGVNHATLMLEISKDPDEINEWKQILIDEIDHLKRIGDWFLEKNLIPLPPNKLVQRLDIILQKAKLTKNNKDILKLIESGQIYLEDLGVLMNRWRMSYLKDLELKSIFYKMIQDEARHIAKGKQILRDNSYNVKSRYDIFFEKGDKLFPIHIAKKILNHSTYIHLLKISPQISKNIFQLISAETERYKPNCPHILIYEKIPGYHCFACSPTRSEGLKIDPVYNAENVSSSIYFSKRNEGINGIVHGGFIAMSLDEIMGYSLNAKYSKIGLTTNLQIKYLKPVLSRNEYVITGKILTNHGNGNYEISGELKSIDQKIIYATSNANFFIPNLKLAEKIIGPIVNQKFLANMFQE